jgi:hypothetical protein
MRSQCSLHACRPRRHIFGGAALRVLDLFLGDELEQDGAAFLRLLDAALDRRDDLGRVGDPLAVAAEGAGEVGVVAGECAKRLSRQGCFHLI